MRPESVCYCRHVTPLATPRTRVILLQHPRERDMAIGTARMASLCLPDSELHVGVRWSGSPVLTRALSDPSRPAALLYPGPGAIDVVANPPPGPITLIVVDGTWWQTKKVVRENPELARLPRYAFTPPGPSEYRIRKEPDADYVSTIEALVHVLGALEADGERFRALLTPFRAMIDAQIDCEQRLRSSRQKKKPKPVQPRRSRLPAVLRERYADLVCVTGEANAWPYRCADRAEDYPDELVHWVARRASTGETLDMIVKPRHPLAPRTSEHVELSEADLASGSTLEDAFLRFRAFVEEDDIVCSWGRYATSLFVASGGWLPPTRLDLRQISRNFTRDKVGTLEEFVTRIRSTLPPTEAEPEPEPEPDPSSPDDEAPPEPKGRAARRITEVCEVLRHFTTAANEP
jgi:DTW domain-containing protein YfiP